MFTKYSIIITVFIIFTLSDLYSAPKYKFNQTIYFLIGFPAGSNSQEFFDVYNRIVGGSNNVLKPTPILGVGTKFVVQPKFKVGLLGCFYETNFNDMYGQKIYPNPESPERWVSEELKIDNYPLFFTVEYSPNLKSQFHTYAGLGLGCNFGKIMWTENIQATVPQDIRKGGILVNQSTYSFTTRTYLGMELGFDKKRRNYLLGGLIVEVAYHYDSREIKMFEKLKKQFFVQHKEFDNSYPIIPGIIELSMAVSLVFE